MGTAPALSATRGKMMITSTPNGSRDLFAKLWFNSGMEWDKKEYTYKKLVLELNDRVKQLESYLPRLQEELEEQKEKTTNRQRQLDHYEMQMHNVDEKYYGHMSVKSKEAEEYARTLAMIKQEKNLLAEKNREANEEIEATKKELALLMKTNAEKMKKINDLTDVIKSLEKKIKDLTE